MAVYELTVADTREEPNDALYVAFDVPDEAVPAFEYIPGQYLTLEAAIDGETMRRSYSICAGPGEPLAVAIKRIPGGRFSEWAHTHLRPGERIKAEPPAGEFHTPLNPARARRYLCITAGSGITPVIAIVKAVLATEPESRVTMLYGNRRSADIIFRESLLWLKNRYLDRFQWINIFSRENQAAPVLNGRLDNLKGAELGRCLIDIPAYDEFFLCGPEGMISEVSRGLRGLGIDDARIHYERFFASAEDAQEAIARHRARAERYAGLTTEVRVRSGGREVSFALAADGENILDGAADNGLDLPFSCKGGVCATCKAKVVEGEVDMDVNHALSREQLDAGFVLTCQAHPVTPTVVVDFDVI